MTDRAKVIAQALAATRWAQWRQDPIAADASARSYARLTGPEGDTAILMDANPATDPSLPAFLQIAEHLRGGGLAAPDILFCDADSGVVILSDLGPTDFADWTEAHPKDQLLLYTAATDVLADLHHLPPPATITARIDAAEAAALIGITGEWYTDRDTTALTKAVQSNFAALTSPPTVLALRDFHAENLIWRSDKTGHDRVGLLDFQDALLAPAGYDLVSLLRDVRRDVDRDLAAQLITRFAHAIGTDPDIFAAQCAMLSAQRNLRILGVFARLILRDKKLKYAQFVPRTWHLIQQDLTHPALADMAAVVQDVLPTPDKSAIASHL